MNQNYCVHPGKLISSILMSINKNKQWLANKIGIDVKRMEDILDGREVITQEIADSIESATGYKALYLLEQQKEYDKYLAHNN